jgi:flavin-dependent dehydrogenase
MTRSGAPKDTLIIGAGPAGSVAGAVLARGGRSVLCLEQNYFPRYVIGESLLPRCNALLEQVGMLQAVRSRGYMVKPGAIFLRGDERERFCFADALKGDHRDTFQVPRDDFDQLLATEARRAGLDLRFGQRVDKVEFESGVAVASVTDLDQGRSYEVRSRFVLDCSGYGRVLPRLLDLERPALLPSRVSCFTQVENDIRPEGDLAGDIWICVHPEDGWIWIIPFSNGRTSVGMVCGREHWQGMTGTNRDRLFRFLRQEPNAKARLANAVPVAPTRAIEGYSKKVGALHGDGWALVGNASDFLDPVFSSGVTLALETAVLAAALVERTLSGEAVRWDEEYDAVVGKAVGVFLAFIESWYRRDLEAIFFAAEKPPRVKRFITSILGGHVLRDDNPLVADSVGFLQQLYQSTRS